MYREWDNPRHPARHRQNPDRKRPRPSKQDYSWPNDCTRPASSHSEHRSHDARDGPSRGIAPYSLRPTACWSSSWSHNCVCQGPLHWQPDSRHRDHVRTNAETSWKIGESLGPVWLKTSLARLQVTEKRERVLTNHGSGEQQRSRAQKGSEWSPKSRNGVPETETALSGTVKAERVSNEAEAVRDPLPCRLDI